MGRKEVAVWTAEQAVQFLRLARDHRLYAAFLLALAAGLRRREILGLRWQDVDLDRGCLSIRQTLARTDTAGNLLEEPKTAGSRRLVVLSPATVEALRERLADHEREKAACAEEYHDTGLVFTTSDGRPVDPRNFTKVFERLVARAGVPRIRFHDLRPTRATLLLAAGIHPKIVSERPGHSDIGTTMDTHSHVLPTQQRGAAAMIDRLLDSPPED
ncbi:MAG: site-specific integrase [Anaerolineae bacterium]|nr:site-specific integrase [Anaerolineae bacterium]